MSGPGMHARLAIGLSLVVVVAVLSAAWGTLILVKRAFVERGRTDADVTAARVELHLQSRIREIEPALAMVAWELQVPGNRFLALASDGARRSDPWVLDYAGRAAEVSGLPVFQILTEDGTVLSSAHWPQQAGVRVASGPEWPEREAILARMPVAAGEITALVKRVGVFEGPERLHLIVGIVMDEVLLREIAPGQAAYVRDAGGRILARSEVPPPSPPDEGMERTIPLRGPSGETEAELVLVLDPVPEDPLPMRLRFLFLLTGAGTILIALLAGLWIARSVTRPVAQMVRAVESVSAGEADYTFPSGRADEFQELIASFSRMQRSLEIERQRLRAAERVAAWREAARRVAHEVKNPLVPIRLTMENLLKAREHAPGMFDEMFRDGARTVLEEVEQLKRIVTEFGDYARMPEPSMRPVDLDGVVDSVTALFGSVDRVEIRRVREGPVPELRLDPDQIAQALKNIVGNAVEAVEAGGGSVKIRTGTEDGMAVVEVTDTGAGLTEEAARRIFEPYFTTKEGGTGLGMAITYRIVTEHGGLLQVESGPEGGTRVLARLPLPGEEPA